MFLAEERHKCETFCALYAPFLFTFYSVSYGALEAAWHQEMRGLQAMAAAITPRVISGYWAVLCGSVTQKTTMQ